MLFVFHHMIPHLAIDMFRNLFRLSYVLLLAWPSQNLVSGGFYSPHNTAGYLREVDSDHSGRIEKHSPPVGFYDIHQVLYVFPSTKLV